MMRFKGPSHLARAKKSKKGTEKGTKKLISNENQQMGQ